VETAAQPTAPLPAHASSGNGEIVEYRTLSVLAIASLAFGLASPLSLLAPLLLAIAFFGAAASIIALQRISSSGGLLAGRGVALVGLALCVASIGAVYGRTIVTRQLLSHQAHAVALQWFELLQSGQAEQAHELTLKRESPLPVTESNDAANEEGGESHALERFLEDPVVRAVTAVGGGADVQWNRNLAIEVKRHGLGMVEQLYTITPADPGQQAFRARLSVQRAKYPGQDRPTWLITSYELEDQPATSAEGG
jgi:hypothetical protein